MADIKQIMRDAKIRRDSEAYRSAVLHDGMGFSDCRICCRPIFEASDVWALRDGNLAHAACLDSADGRRDWTASAETVETFGSAYLS